MIRIRICLKDGRVRRIESEGHSGYAESGADIVCAAVTSAFRLLETQLNDVLQLGASLSVDEKRAFLSIQIHKTAAGSDAVTQGFRLYMQQLAAEYPEHISVTMEAPTDAASS